MTFRAVWKRLPPQPFTLSPINLNQHFHQRARTLIEKWQKGASMLHISGRPTLGRWYLLGGTWFALLCLPDG